MQEHPEINTSPVIPRWGMTGEAQTRDVDSRDPTTGRIPKQTLVYVRKETRVLYCPETAGEGSVSYTIPSSSNLSDEHTLEQVIRSL